MTKTIDGSELVRFELDNTYKENFNLYQDAVAKYPGSFYQLKMRYDQFLKTKKDHDKEIQAGHEEHEIEFVRSE